MEFSLKNARDRMPPGLRHWARWGRAVWGSAIHSSTAWHMSRSQGAASWSGSVCRGVCKKRAFVRPCSLACCWASLSISSDMSQRVRVWPWAASERRMRPFNWS